MTRYRRAHLRNGLRKFCDALELVAVLRAPVILVIEILPTARRVFPDRLESSICGGIDEDVSPRRRDFQFVNTLQNFTRERAVRRFVAKSSFGSAEPAYADILQPFEIRHSDQLGSEPERNLFGIGCTESFGQSGRLI